MGKDKAENIPYVYIYIYIYMYKQEKDTITKR